MRATGPAAHATLSLLPPKPHSHSFVPLLHGTHVPFRLRHRTVIRVVSRRPSRRSLVNLRFTRYLARSGPTPLLTHICSFGCATTPAPRCECSAPSSLAVVLRTALLLRGHAALTRRSCTSPVSSLRIVARRASSLRSLAGRSGRPLFRRSTGHFHFTSVRSVSRLHASSCARSGRDKKGGIREGRREKRKRVDRDGRTGREKRLEGQTG